MDCPEERIFYLGHALVSVIGHYLQGFRDDLCRFFANAGINLPHRGELEKLPSTVDIIGEEVVERGTQRVNIGAGISLAVAVMLRRGSDNRAELHRIFDFLLLENAGNAKIDELDDAVRIK